MQNRANAEKMQKRRRKDAALRLLRFCVSALMCPFCGFLQAAALEVTETRLGPVDSQCVAIRLFDVALNGKDFSYAGPADLKPQTASGRPAAWAIWSGGRMVGAADSVVLLQFSSSGRLLIGGTRDGREFVSLSADPKTPTPDLQTYDHVNWRSVTCSPDGSALLFAAVREGRWVVVNNGVEGRRYDGVGLPCISRDGKTVRYPAFEGERFGKAQWFIVSGGKEGKRYDAEFLGWVKEGAQVRKSAGAQEPVLAYVVAQNGKAWVVDNERAGTKYDDVGWLGFAPGTNRLYYAARAHGKWFVVKDGYPLRERYDDITYLGFSPDGRRMAFVGASRDKQFCVVDGNRGPSWDEVLLPQFSPDSRRVGYLARRNDKWSAVVNGRASKACDGVSWLTWNRTSTDFAYRTRTGNRYGLVINGSETRLYDDITRLWWSPENRALLAAARQGRELLLLRADVKK
jgi:hypothetical protein